MTWGAPYFSGGKSQLTQEDWHGDTQSDCDGGSIRTRRHRRRLGGGSLHASRVFGSTDEVSCEITNVSAQTRSFTFQLIDTSGAVRVSGQNTLAPGASGGEGTFGPTIANELFHCHFDVAGTKAPFRAAIKRRDFSTGSGGDIVVVPAD